MKKLPLILLSILCAAAIFSACGGDDQYTELQKTYQAWNDENQAWLEEMTAKKNSDGSDYYQKVSPAWNPSAYVLIHYFNDRQLTEGNLTPMFTSTVDTRYRVTYCNDVALDSSYNLTTWGEGIFRTKPSEVITGWAIALQDMRVGDTAEVVIPYESAYGISSTSVLPYSNLKFNMSLIDIYAYEVNPDGL